MKVLEFKRPETAPVKDNSSEFKFYQDYLWNMASYLEREDVTTVSVNRLLGMISLGIAKLTISAENVGIEVRVDKLMDGIIADIDTEMENYLTTDDYKPYFNKEE